jgi:arginyl-tRNA synthetase
MKVFINNMKPQIENLIQTALKQLQASGELQTASGGVQELPAMIQVDPTRDKQHGDFASNIAMILAKPLQKKPREIAAQIIAALPPSSFIEKTEIAGPGFINFFLTPGAMTAVVEKVLSEKEKFGHCKVGREKRVLVEFLSANPNGPYHVGHGRGAAFGDIISNLLDAVGFKTYREYYVNDAGRQMDILTASVWLRYLALCGEEIVFPVNAYRGEYVIDIAKEVFAKHQTEFQVAAKNVFDGLPPDETEGGDKEIYIDEIIKRCKQFLGKNYEAFFNFGLESVLKDMRDDLAEFGVKFDNWFSERKFVATDVVDKLLEKLTHGGHVYEKEGALWFRSTDFGDEKDRVLVRSNGVRTYFANDVAYHLSKFDRGFDIAVDVFGADHHGYVPRMKAAMQASEINPERLQHVLLQFVTLYRGGNQVQMSTRSGTFVTLRELREEVGNDAARFFYVMRKAEQHIDFDLDLAKSQSNENPVYYVQYAYARICSVFKQLSERNLEFDQTQALAHLNLLTQPQEQDLLNTISRFPDLIISAAINYEPHQLTNYLRHLAGDFHAYYNAHHFIVEEAALRNARLALVMATRQILLNGFKLLGIQAPETM